MRRELERRAGSALPDWERFAAGAQLCSGAAGKELPTYEHDSPGIHIITSGLLKATVTMTTGRPRIVSFPRAGDIVAGLAFLSAAAAVPTLPDDGTEAPCHGDGKLTALVPTTALRFDAAMTLELAERHRAWSTLAIRLLAELILLRTLRLNDHLALTAEERYLKVLRDESPLVRRISQRDLALYLGVTPEALSRIASRSRDRRRLAVDAD